MKRTALLAALVGLAVLIAILVPRRHKRREPPAGQERVKLYWFIPDGMRADPDVFNVFRWARDGRLPNIRKMMEEGTYGFSRPTFPSHTPTNFATLFTGCYPEVHGVNDGPMRTEGNPLSGISIGGFSSAAKLVAPIWVTLERQAGHKVALLSIPGSTPPELERGITVRGRWGGWGADFHPVIFQSQGDLSLRKEQGRASRLFFFGPQLTQYVEARTATGDAWVPDSYSETRAMTLTAWGASVHGCVLDTTDNGTVDYDRVTFSLDGREADATLAQGEWSQWLPCTLKWTIPDRDLEQPLETLCRIHVVKLEPDGFFRIRLQYNNLNRHLTDPPEVAAELTEAVGPMVDFVDNFPPQLIFYPEDKSTFLEEARQSLEWHRRAADHILTQHTPDVFIQDIYTPNQMLTSRWWMGSVDPTSRRYSEVSDSEREKLWREVHWLYEELDRIVGTILENADENTIVVLSSDHGAVPLDRWVRLNNLLAREGLLRFQIDPETGEPLVDWTHTRAIYLKMHSIYLNPDGLAGPWRRASGVRYDALRERVKDLLVNLEDTDGTRPIVKVLGWEDARRELRLRPERTGDLILANRPGYGWSEEMTADLAFFSSPLKSGYKQAILAERVPGMWTPFVIMGPGVKKAHSLGEEPIEMADQYPTILKLMGLEAPDHVQGRVLADVLVRD